MLARLALAALPLLSVALAADCTRNATVQSGDTCDSISNKYGASTFQLALVNEADIDENCENLQPGETICLGVAGQDCTKVYTVKSGDTCEWLMATYGMSNTTLWSNNPQIDPECTNIYIGEVLCVDTKSYNYPSYNQSLYEAMAYTYLPYC
ncbi:hypothetical protein BD324DRAFT_628452 [Kockovaella imperatae]|uniref:LysM domain-containing protein n=1 Tax=Kockovaella imperatae TaxID=4999 RepID=A0A1Y1UFR8_9TREE|nr:hypothetical protein BD324DRAFT_628452 [Kockovaella imperatae]ORX36354.1 hypothetical protein BD324DRAFT_628452 [Kockovaella imperatae]